MAPEVGFAYAARWIAADGDGEALVFRKFDRLAARNLLCLQARMLSLERRISALDGAVLSDQGLALTEIMCDWDLLKQHSESPDGHEVAKKHMLVLEELRTAIKEYHEALDLQHKISALSAPNKRVVGAYRAFLENTPCLGGPSGRFLDAPDLVAIKSPADHDPLSELLRRIWPVSTAGHSETDVEAGIGRFQERSIVRAANIVSIVLAMALLAGSIVGLSFYKDPYGRIGIVVGCTIVFALSLGIITNARRPEIFAATAAYAAVLVVFISTQ
ncbi:hypothetical protein GGTG_04228 [Gaeumannomyces tritici R3-111a-1]|uniref:DUF6594 domain-containing protein n=1 Tax=Gaeumannomyces tritici (strain R3-111a-1) TaxID=644352 RepID=J3NSH6_GAET3|nr:hypothetical protein GGTG_04228 [Gaeumannomyces tritici R3-111a-1]EJT79139.1 hypothetical protein GGTG_04228 [Gaeumannomyces tritici R3-111a-1]